jgi:hypothetical protein
MKIKVTILVYIFVSLFQIASAILRLDFFTTLDVLAIDMLFCLSLLVLSWESEINSKIDSEDMKK